MSKKLRDITTEKTEEKINLRPKRVSKFLAEKMRFFRKPKPAIYKAKMPIKQVQDLTGNSPRNYQYFKGKTFHPPRFLGNLLRIGFGGFLILLIVNAVNVYTTSEKLKAKIEGEATEGYSYLVDAGKNATKTQFDSALDSFDKALVNFNEAKTDLWFITSDKSFYAGGASLQGAVQSLFQAGKYFSTAGKAFVEAIEEFNKVPIYFVSQNEQKSENNEAISSIIKAGLAKTNEAITQIALASEEIAKIDQETLPPEVSGRIAFAKEKTAEISSVLNSIADTFPALLKLIGSDKPHRYLFLLQNNNEIRPSGGFIGSYALVDMKDGNISNLETNDVYDLDMAYLPLIEPPEELKSFTNNWRFRDSNYSGDFAVSAAKGKWFFEKEGGPKIDTVIAINQGLLQDMLAITGPIQVGNFGKLSAENYNLLLTFIIESRVWGTEDPKHILKVFIPAFKEAIMKQENLAKVGSKIYKAIQQKHILFYSPDPEIQSLFDSFGLSGRMAKTPANEDYLSIINSSTGGTKSDNFIEENITHDTSIDANGRLIDEVTIKRTHQWDDKIYFQWKKTLQEYGFTYLSEHLADIIGRGRNVVNMRIYVPKGAVFISGSKNGNDYLFPTKYDSDLGKTYFFDKLETLTGGSSVIKIKYELPFVLTITGTPATYKLTVQKQPGSRGSIFNKTFATAPELSTLNYYPPDARESGENALLYATNLVYDRYFAAVVQK